LTTPSRRPYSLPDIEEITLADEKIRLTTKATASG